MQKMATKKPRPSAIVTGLPAQKLIRDDISISNSLQNDYDELRDIMKEQAIMFRDAARLQLEQAKLHLEQSKQLTDIIKTMSMLGVVTGEHITRPLNTHSNHVEAYRRGSRLTQSQKYIPVARSRSTVRD